MAGTVKARASLMLRGTTMLDPERTLQVLRASAGAMRGGRMPTVTTGIGDLGAQVHVVREAEGLLWMTMTSGRQLATLCTFCAHVWNDAGTTNIRVGGLDHYRTQQPRLFQLVPIGPATIKGMAAYRRLLEHLRAEITIEDPGARLTVSQESRPR